MLILGDLSAEVPDTNAFHWNLEELSNDADLESALIYGYNASDNEQFFDRLKDYKRKIYFNNWAPCEFAQQRTKQYDAFKKEHFFDQIYSICPYSNKWLNMLGFDREYKDIFYPFHKSLVPENHEKEYDVIYHGGIHGQEHINCLRVMLNFNYRYCTMSRHINELTARCATSAATDADLSFQEKINLIAKTKISVCYNLVHISQQDIPVIKSYDEWQENEAFSEVGGWNVMPQFKTRMHEAAFSRTLNLVLKDRWNIAERYYEPEKEFIYFENADDLYNKIKMVLNDWGDYQDVIENAYNRSMQYTTNRFVETIEENK